MPVLLPQGTRVCQHSLGREASFQAGCRQRLLGWLLSGPRLPQQEMVQGPAPCGAGVPAGLHRNVTSDILALSALIHVCLAQQSFSCLSAGQQPDLVQATSWRLSFQSQLPLWHHSDKFCEIVQAKINLLHLEHSRQQKTLCYFLLLLSRQVTLVYVG